MKSSQSLRIISKSKTKYLLIIKSNCSSGVYDRITDYLDTYNNVVKRKISEKNNKLFYLITALEKGSDTTISIIRNSSGEIRDKIDELKEIEWKIRKGFDDSLQK